MSTISGDLRRDAAKWLDEELTLTKADLVRYERSGHKGNTSGQLWRRYRALQTLEQLLSTVVVQ